MVVFSGCAGCDVGSDSRHHICTSTCGYLASPGFPFPYDDDIDVSWFIHVAFGSYIKLTFLRMNVESPSPGCPADYVLVHDVDASGNLKVSNIYSAMGEIRDTL